MERILLDTGWSIRYHYGDVSVKLETPLGPREYWPDIFALKDQKWTAFEVDGSKGHSTKIDLRKMKMRDETLAEKGIQTVRIRTDDLLGRKKQPLEIILEEIEYQRCIEKKD